VGHFDRPLKVEGDVAHQPLWVAENSKLVSWSLTSLFSTNIRDEENSKDCPFMWYKNIDGLFFGLVTKHTFDRQTHRWTDGRTDGQNYDSQDRAIIAASRGKKHCRPITATQHGVILDIRVDRPHSTLLTTVNTGDQDL